MFYNIKALSLQVFFMVLDLRLRRLPVVMTSNFFLCLPEPSADAGFHGLRLIGMDVSSDKSEVNAPF